jgi:hypothetical protein
VRIIAPSIKYPKANMDFKKPDNVQGNLFFATLFLIRILKRKGINICDMMTTQAIPTIEIIAIDFNAGCFANINTPKPAIVVIAERKMDDL